MHIHLGRVAFGGGESDFVALLHQGANRNRQFVEIVASALVTSAIFQGQAATARDQYQDFSFCCHLVLLFLCSSFKSNPFTSSQAFLSLFQVAKRNTS